MTHAERVAVLGEELCLRWLHRIPEEEQASFLRTVRWSLEEAAKPDGCLPPE